MFIAWVLLVLFTRIDAGNLLASPVRRDMVALLRARPGARVGELAQSLRVDYKTALHHARMLARAEMIVMRADQGQRRCWMPADAAKGVEPPPRAVAALHAVHAGARTPAQLALLMGLPRGTAGSLLATMARRGLLARDAEGGYVVAEAAAALLSSEERFWAGRRLGGRWSRWSSEA